jgi:hypothetical protein
MARGIMPLDAANYRRGAERTDGQVVRFAAQSGVTPTEWKRLRATGYLWCGKCREWKEKGEFSKDDSRTTAYCTVCKKCAGHLAVAKRCDISFEEAKRAREATACEICGRSGKIAIDHCHKSGKFRGTICYKCNQGIGCFKDNVELMIDAIEYLISRTPGLMEKFGPDFIKKLREKHGDQDCGHDPD